MSKPLPSQVLFSPLAPPWSLTQLDSNISNVYAAINDIGTYTNVLSDTGAVNALTVTPAAGITFVLTAGITLDVVVGNTTTSATPTLNVNATGAKTIVDSAGTALLLGALVATGRYRFVYDGTNYRCMNPTAATFNGGAASPALVVQANGTTIFQAGGTTAPVVQVYGPVAAALVDATPDKSSWITTLSGPWVVGNNVTGTLKWERQGTQVTIWADANITQTATLASFIFASAVPAAITPSSQRIVTCSGLENNGSSYLQGSVTINTNNTLAIALSAVTGSLITTQSNFTGAGVTGINVNWSITYSL